MAKRWSNKKVAIVSVVTIAVLFVCTELIWGGYTIVSSYLASDFDRSTTGTITVSDRLIREFQRKTDNSKTPIHDIRYDYTVEGITYQGRLVNFRDMSENVDEILHRYPKGKKVRVFYNSKNPEVCVLEATALSWDIISTYILIVICVPLIVWFSSRGGY